LVGMAFHRIHFLANETPSSKSLNHFNNLKAQQKRAGKHLAIRHVSFSKKILLSNGQNLTFRFD
jgi:hypothetical protein